MPRIVIFAVAVLLLHTPSFGAIVPRITAATVEQSGHLVIVGDYFGRAPIVRLGGVALTDVEVHDDPAGEWIRASVPAGTAPGSYTLVVIRTVFPKLPSLPFEVTLGAAGPAGPPGPPGPPGTLPSFDALAGLTCTRGTESGTIELTYAADGTVSLRCVVSGPPPPPGPPLDVVLLMDSTGSMSGPINNLIAGLTGTLIPAIRAAYPDSAFAVAEFHDFPLAPYGDASDFPYRLKQALTPNIPSVQAAVNSLAASGGNDVPESGTAAVFALASGSALTWPGGTTPATNVGFRANSKRVVVVVTDADFHNNYVGGEPYSFPSPTYANAVTALTQVGAKLVGLHIVNGSNVSALLNLESYAVATGAWVAPANGACFTGINGVARAPDGAGQCPLVYQATSVGTGVTTAIRDGVLQAAGQ